MFSPTYLVEHFRDLITVRTGLILNDHQIGDLPGMLDDLAASTGCPQPDDMLALLLESPVTHPLWQRIVHAITVGETYFFRNRPQFEALRAHILPGLIEARRASGNKHLRLWSAGSATGEEPYSLAILLRELIPDIETWSISLLATDLNEDYLAQARQGIYRARSFRSETPPGLRDAWFTESPVGARLISAVRNMVIFKPLNLISDEYPALENNTTYMDVILCRNVTIYFDRETTRLVASRFHQALNPGGWLVVGHSEPQAELYQGFVSRNFKDTVLYQKADDAPAFVSIQEAQPVAVLPIQPAGRPVARRREAPVAAPRPEAPPFDVCWTRAKIAADLEQWAEARTWLDRAEQQDAFQPQVHYLRALVELQTRHQARGIQLLRRAVYCDAGFALAHYLLGELYHQQGAFKDAIRHWQLALSAVEHDDAQRILPYSDDLTVEMLVELLAERLAAVS